MTFTKQYIKMCKKAKKIQECRKSWKQWKFGNWYFREKLNTIGVCNTDYEFERDPDRHALSTHIFWLPTQQDLQEMVIGLRTGDENIYMDSMYLRVQEFAELASQVAYTFRSMEELWLGFVMWELHHKQWNGNEWLPKSSNPESPNRVVGNETGNEVERREG